MKSITEAKRLAAALASEFGGGDLHINVQMQRGESWINIDMYQNSDEPERLLATLDFDTGSHLLWIAREPCTNTEASATRPDHSLMIGHLCIR